MPKLKGSMIGLKPSLIGLKPSARLGDNCRYGRQQLPKDTIRLSIRLKIKLAKAPGQQTSPTIAEGFSPIRKGFNPTTAKGHNPKLKFPKPDKYYVGSCRPIREGFSPIREGFSPIRGFTFSGG